MATSLLSASASDVRTLPSKPQAPLVLLAAAESAERTALEALLRAWGHPVEAARDGASLLQSLDRKESVPILILDNDLPGLRGMALLQRLQLESNRRRSWTIILAGIRDPAESPGGKGPSREAGVDDILARPLDEFALRVSLHAAARVHARCAEMVEAIDAARFHASHDNLTGMLNRESLLNMLFQETDRTQRLGSSLSFLLLDLDHFSRVNHEYGYDGGDRILRQLASRFRRFLRSYDVAGRCGGNQFLIAMPGCTQEDARSMASRLRDCVSERPFDILQTTVAMTASIGVAQSRGRSPLAVLREAEFALSRAKLAGGDCARWFSSPSNHSETSSGTFPADSARTRGEAVRSVPVSST